MRFYAFPLFVSLAVAGAAPASAAKPKTFEKEYKAAVKLENAGDLMGALAAFEAIPEDKRDYDGEG